MKSTGIVRRIDDLGRIVIPKELRKVYNIEEGEPLEIFTEDDKIIFRKFNVNPIGDRISSLKNLLQSKHNYKDIEACLDVLEDLCKE